MATMTSMTEMKPTFDDGREAQYREMMQQLALLQSKYKGVRGELLQKVREEFVKLKPSAASPAGTPTAAPSPVRAVLAPDKILPSCRLCGRGMKLNGTSGFICSNGHIRAAS
ncbi:MAG: hypothetical protein Q8L48_36615 [Archangium sp.]|nr:hypothetical protein [Archangium sp.]